jgi:hypothetical protein
MKLFDIDIKKMVIQLTPSVLRKELIVFLHAAIEPVAYIYINFFINRNRNIILLQHHTGKSSIEALMKKTFGAGIYITQGLTERALYLSEQNPVYLSTISPSYIYPEGVYLPKSNLYLSEINPVYIGITYLNSYITVPDYTIHVPSTLWNVYQSDIENYAHLFSLPGMTFNFNIY